MVVDGQFDIMVVSACDLDGKERCPSTCHLLEPRTQSLPCRTCAAPPSQVVDFQVGHLSILALTHLAAPQSFWHRQLTRGLGRLKPAMHCVTWPDGAN